MPLGIELSSVACRLVELDRGARWHKRAALRVRSYHAWAQGAGATGSLAVADTPAMLRPFRGRRASVVLWNVQTDHRVLRVHSGEYERMRLEARARVRETGLVLDDVLSDIAPASPRTSAGNRQEVMLASAPSAEVAAAIVPLIRAGIKVEAVLTPAAALQSLARLRALVHSPSAHDADIEAWIALTETSGCIAVLRAGRLIDTHDVSWGFLDELSDFQTQRDRYDVAVRLADEVGALTTRRCDARLAQVFVCGAMPELRSMSVQLMDRVDVEVEPLDSLFGIDERHLPGSDDVFHEAVSGLRLAWAAARNSRPALNLYRAPRRRATRIHLSRAAVFAGAAAGLSVGWSIARALPSVPAVPRAAVANTVEWPATKMPTASRFESASPGKGSLVPLASRVIAAPAGMLIATMIPAPLSVPDQSEERARIPANSPPRPWESVPPLMAVARIASAPPVAGSPDGLIARVAEPLAPVHGPSAPAPKAAGAPKPPSEKPALPFDATLQTVLFSRDRSLAIVDGRIVQVGDEVQGSRIVEITAGAVMLRDSGGRLHRLSLGGH